MVFSPHLDIGEIDAGIQAFVLHRKMELGPGELEIVYCSVAEKMAY